MVLAVVVVVVVVVVGVVVVVVVGVVVVVVAAGVVVVVVVVAAVVVVVVVVVVTVVVVVVVVVVVIVVVVVVAAAAAIVGYEMPLERRPKVMPFLCSATLATRSPGFSSYFGVAVAINYPGLHKGCSPCMGAQSDPKHRLVGRVRSAPRTKAQGHVVPLQRCACITVRRSPCLSSLVGYETPFERRPQVMSFPCSAVLASQSPFFFPILVLLLLFSVITQGYSRYKSPKTSKVSIQ